MKILLNIIIILNLSFSFSQTEIDSLILSSHSETELILFEIVSEKILIEHFNFKPENTIIEIYNKPIERLQRLNLNEYSQSEFKLTQYWISYNVSFNNRILTKLDFSFDSKGNLAYSKKGIKEILNPYLKVLNHKTKIDLENAIRIAEKNGLTEIYNWDIDYEKRKLVWTIKSKLENNKSKVIKINSKSGKILSNFIEIPID